MKIMFLQELTGGLFGGLLKGLLLNGRFKGLFTRTPVLAVLFLTAVVAACASDDSKSGGGPPPKADCVLAEDVGNATDCGLLALPQTFDYPTTYNITVGEVLAGQEVNTTKIRLGNFNFTQIINGNISDPKIVTRTNNQIELLANATALNLNISGIDENLFGEFYIDLDLVLVNNSKTTVKVKVHYTISITPVNDAPVFSAVRGSESQFDATATPARYDFADIPFNSTIGYSVGNVSTTDVDSDTISYSISGGTNVTNLFQINQATGEITLKEVAVNPGNSPIPYTFIITASDGNRGSVTTEITVMVLTDNQAPMFGAGSYRFDGIPFNSLTGHSVGNVSAMDPDAADGDAVTYTIGNEYIRNNGASVNNDLFQISSTGEITLKAQATNSGNYVFNVIASDGKGGSTTAIISVEVLPNQAPVFEEGIGSGQFAPATDTTPANYTFDGIPFNSLTDYSVGNVLATDTDGGTVGYSISGGTDDTDLFVISSTGEITLKAQATNSGNYVFNVIANDGQGGTATATISVEVLPTLPPVFSAGNSPGVDFTLVDGATPANYIFAGILQNSSANDLVGNVSAMDFDGGTVSYRITGGTDDTALFQINLTTGEVTLKDIADTLGTYQFNVIASDGQGGTATATISVKVLRTLPLVFEEVIGAESQFTPAAGATPANYDFAFIPHNSPVGYSVGNVSARDDNSDTLTYSIHKDDSALFQIDPTTGEITLKAIATDLGEYQFSVNATNEQDNMTEATISVAVGDPTPPVFASTPYNFDLLLSEANAAGVVVGKVSARDTDGTPFDYNLAGSDTLFDDLFELATAKNADGSINIILSRAATLSDFTVPSVTSQVVATHQGGGLSSEPANITVNLINDLQPSDDFDGDGVMGLYDAFPHDGAESVTGNGAAGTPYIISNIYQLQAIAGFDHTGTALGSSSFTNNGFLYGTTAADQLTKHYKLANDINASTTNTDIWDKPAVTGYIGRGWTPIAGKSGQSFSGSFSGEGYAISNLNISLRAAARTDSFGLFGTSSGNISAVGLENIEMRIQAVGNNVEIKKNGPFYAPYQGSGGLVGRNEAGGVIQYSYTSGLVNATAYNVGGLVGRNIAEISYSYSTAAVEGHINSGGLVGASSDTEIGGAANKILSSYATGTVSGHAGYSSNQFVISTAGGLVGLVNSVAQRTNNIMVASYATGVVLDNAVNGASGEIGAFVGRFLVSEDIVASYWYNNTAFPNINGFSENRGNTFPLAISDAQLRGCELGGVVISGVTPAPTCTGLFPSSSWGNDTTDGVTRGWIFNADEYPSLSAVRSSDNKQLFPTAADQECQRNGMPFGCE